MRVSATFSTGHGGAIGPHRSSLPSLYLTPSFSQQLYDHKHNWKPMRTRIEIPKICRTSARANAKSTSERDMAPREVSQGWREYYLDVQDVVTFLDPRRELIPLDPSSYNPASYLWKKIEDIPEERRHHLLYLLNPRLVTHIKSLGAPLPIAWISFAQKVIFSCTDGKAYGRLIGWADCGICGTCFNEKVTQLNEVMSTEQPCDFAYEFGDGLLNLPQYPQEFPKPARHPWPFNDQVVIYIRHVSPGVLVGQAWQEGKALEQVPKKLCNEILMVKDYFGFSKKV
ncbi:hypothetical protein CDL12_19481 [Handroanthus impetiginosus]|uniref:Uncharacterized protein n=1 Tax=Handroanthus impetiginosus TaxID=429701 RepID=A0A2G9GRP0_9LAMI|nr:hypothetical protein CDL12_19481 [Handroanthus impetiginosus]